MSSGQEHLYMKKVATALTYRCNLKCELCSARVAYMKNKYHPSYDELLNRIERLFCVVNEVGMLNYVGGEPLLRADLPDLIRYTNERYSEKIRDTVRISTNGTIIPSDELIKAAQSCGDKISFAISLYSPETSPHALKAMEVLREAGIRCELHDYYTNPYFGGWVDYGDHTQKKSYEEAVELYKKCYQHIYDLCWEYDFGELHPCGLSQLCMYCNIIPPNEAEFVDLFDTSTTDEQKRDKIGAMIDLPVLTACMYCNGMHEKSERFQAGVQLPADVRPIYDNRVR